MNQGVIMDLSKVEAMVSWPKLNSVKALCVFQTYKLLLEVSELWQDSSDSHLDVEKQFI